jgi:hypothetical protein
VILFRSQGDVIIQVAVIASPGDVVSVRNKSGRMRGTPPGDFIGPRIGCFLIVKRQTHAVSPHLQRVSPANKKIGLWRSTLPSPPIILSPEPNMIDMPLEDRVMTALDDNPYLSRRTLRFETEEGRVILRGVVNTFFQKQMAQEALRRVEGIEEISNELEVSWA